jgi:hypothetical protein
MVRLFQWKQCRQEIISRLGVPDRVGLGAAQIIGEMTGFALEKCCPSLKPLFT